MKRKNKNENVKGLDIAAAISGVTKEKSISMDLVLDTLKDALCHRRETVPGQTHQRGGKGRPRKGRHRSLHPPDRGRDGVRPRKRDIA